MKTLESFVKGKYPEVLKEFNSYVEQKENKNKIKLEEAISLMNENGIKQLSLGNYGIYRQYEVAGESINFHLLDDCDLEEELYEKFENLLSFVDEKYIYKTLGFSREGQNELFLDVKKGFIEKEFSI